MTKQSGEVYRSWRQRAVLRLRDVVQDESGDVPGWVLITLMTAGLVFVLWALAGPALLDLFTQALNQFEGM